MGRPPCCDKVGVKKGPWTPEEDLMLVSYVQEHGPGNWRAVPINTGLMRCSKSCRLRWTNYLRPGIKRGNFTDQEEKLIIDLQAFLGNRWAAIATYMPERTDNDIKNYWNTHLKKKLKKMQAGEGGEGEDGAAAEVGDEKRPTVPKGQWERRLQTDIQTARQALREALSLEPSPPITDQEEKLIIHLQALLGNRWAAIASYMPERTDNDIKNYWNTHLEKKLKKMQAGEGGGGEDGAAAEVGGEKRQALREALSLEPSPPTKVTPLPTPAASATYASSAENIARLLEGWLRPGSGKGQEASAGSSSTTGTTKQRPQCSGEGAASASASASHSGGMAAAAVQTPECSTETSKIAGASAPPAFSMLESWLFDDGMGHGEVGLIDVVPLGDPSEFF